MSIINLNVDIKKYIHIQDYIFTFSGEDRDGYRCLSDGHRGSINTIAITVNTREVSLCEEFQIMTFEHITISQE